MQVIHKTRSTGIALKKWLDQQPIGEQSLIKNSITDCLALVNGAPVQWNTVKNWMLRRVYMPTWAYQPLQERTGIDFESIAVDSQDTSHTPNTHK